MKSVLRFAFAIVMMLTGSELVAQPCSTAGTAAASLSEICPGASTTLQLTGFVGAIQWQSFDGSVWNNETGTGFNTASYAVSPGTSTDYRAVVTEPSCDPDTSNIVSITLGVNAPSAVGASRCGYGPVTLTATGTGIKWYDVPSGGSALAQGNSFSPTVSTTTTYYAASSLGGGPPSPITTTFIGGNGFDGNMFDIIAINTVTIDSFAANFNVGSGTAEIWYKPGTHVGFTGSNVGWTLAGTAAYTSTGNGAPGTSINVNVNVTIPAGQTYAFYVHGTGGITYTNGAAVGNIFVADANLQVTEGFGGAYFNLVNSPRVFNGRIMYSAGCESARTPVVATVTSAPTITVNANPLALCQGQTSNLTVSSPNANYTYTWSPSTGLNTTSGTSVDASPLSPITYTVVANDGTCGNIDSVSIAVGPASIAGTAVISTDTICLGSEATLFLSGNTGNIQWQSNNGGGWVNETGAGSTTGQYLVTPNIFTEYRAVVTSGGCDPDTTVTLSLTVIAVTDPVTTNDTICGPGAASLSANGAGVMNWFTDPTGGTSLFTGNIYTPNVSNTTTYYVEASAGGTYNVGPPNLSMGTQFTVAGDGWGVQFDVTNQISLDRVFVSPGGTTGNLIINLRASQGGPILATKTVAVSAFSGLQPIALGWTINPGTGYRLEMGAGSVPMYYNSFGAVYPYTFAGSSVSITGFLNPNAGTGSFYYFFYNWEITEGCKSNRVPATVTVINPPAAPAISQFGTVLTSSVTSNIQWYLNGSPIPGATQATYDMALSGSGSYTVVVTDPATGCSAESSPVLYTGINDPMSLAGIAIYPNPVSEQLTVEYNKQFNETVLLSVYNALGEKVKDIEITGEKTMVDFSTNAPGVYIAEIRVNDKVYRRNLVKK